MHQSSTSDLDHKVFSCLRRRHWLKPGDRLGVAVSGGADSMALLRSLVELRYEFFWSLIEDSRLDKIATAHTLDDQAETVLLRLMRGTGTRGLGGIHPELTGPAPDRTSRGLIIRPLLLTRRRDIERYLAGLGQRWREDSSN